MLVLDERRLAELLDYRSLVEAIRAMFRAGCTMPLRHRHAIDVPGAPQATLLLMPAWQEGAYLGVKIANVFPGNAAAGRPAVSAAYVLFDARDGRPLAAMDGAELTVRRTAAASVLAASYLARTSPSHHLVVGTGHVARHLPRAYAAFFPTIRTISIWGRHHEKARGLAEHLRSLGLPATTAADLRTAVQAADIISCATLAEEPQIKGAWLRAGQHLDLIGGFTPAMREADDDAIAGARVFVDTCDGALHEAGDIVQPVRSGRLDADAIIDLYALTRETAAGRGSEDEITVFKSVGAGLEDLAGAVLAYQRANTALV